MTCEELLVGGRSSFMNIRDECQQMTVLGGCLTQTGQYEKAYIIHSGIRVFSVRKPGEGGHRSKYVAMLRPGFYN